MSQNYQDPNAGQAAPSASSNATILSGGLTAAASNVQQNAGQAAPSASSNATILSGGLTAAASNVQQTAPRRGRLNYSSSQGLVREQRPWQRPTLPDDHPLHPDNLAGDPKAQQAAIKQLFSTRLRQVHAVKKTDGQPVSQKTFDDTVHNAWFVFHHTGLDITDFDRHDDLASLLGPWGTGRLGNDVTKWLIKAFKAHGVNDVPDKRLFGAMLEKMGDYWVMMNEEEGEWYFSGTAIKRLFGLVGQ